MHLSLRREFIAAAVTVAAGLGASRKPKKRRPRGLVPSNALVPSQTLPPR